MLVNVSSCVTPIIPRFPAIIQSFKIFATAFLDSKSREAVGSSSNKIEGDIKRDLIKQIRADSPTDSVRASLSRIELDNASLSINLSTDSISGLRCL